MTDRLGRADLHIHTLASDGTAGVIEILEHVEQTTDLNVIAITDHERIDAAKAAQVMARDRGYRVEVAKFAYCAFSSITAFIQPVFPTGPGWFWLVIKHAPWFERIPLAIGSRQCI